MRRKQNDRRNGLNAQERRQVRPRVPDGDVPIAATGRSDEGAMLPFASADERLIDFLVEEAVRAWWEENSRD